MGGPLGIDEFSEFWCLLLCLFFIGTQQMVGSVLSGTDSERPFKKPPFVSLGLKTKYPHVVPQALVALLGVL